MPNILILEPFYGGSHKQLIDTVTSRLEADQFDLVTLPAKKWHWRARTSALKLSQTIPRDAGYKTLFTSSVLSLSELIGLRPDLAKLNKILYFHENQLCYPVQNVKDRDFQFGYNQITSALCADQVLFNSDYNMQSFLDNIQKYLSLQPDQRPEPTRMVAEIREKSQVCYFPLQLDKIPRRGPAIILENRLPLHIVWPHRWEHDKDPEMFCRVMTKLHDEGHTFRLSVLGEVFSEIPDVMHKMKEALGGKIKVFGYLPRREDYLDLLGEANVVLSTARHEFYGVAVLEASWAGCYPLVPNNLVYPEIYPPECLYNTEQQLYKRLVRFCSCPSDAVDSHPNIEFERFTGSDPLNKLLSLVTGWQDCD